MINCEPRNHQGKMLMIVDVSHSVCYNVVKVFSLNRIISLAERQAFAHCCELLQVWRKCFPCNLGKPKLYGKMFIFIILVLINICIGRCYANFRLIFAYVINMPLCYVTDILAYVYKEADVIAFDCMADVIAMFSSIEQMLSPYLVYVHQEADVIAFYDYIGRCYCHVFIYIALPNMHIKVVKADVVFLVEDGKSTFF